MTPITSRPESQGMRLLVTGLTAGRSTTPILRVAPSECLGGAFCHYLSAGQFDRNWGDYYR